MKRAHVERAAASPQTANKLASAALEGVLSAALNGRTLSEAEIAIVAEAAAAIRRAIREAA